MTGDLIRPPPMHPPPMRPTPMRIVLDMQGAQGASRFRGIGRYAVSLARALLTEPHPHEIWLLLSGLMPEGAAALRAVFADLLPLDRIRCMALPGPVQEIDAGNAWRMQAAELLREHVLMELAPDLVLVMSPAEGLGTEVVTSAGRLHPKLATAAILYDLIPLLRPDSYLANAQVHRGYLRRMQALKQTSLLLAISDAARLEGIAQLDIPADRVVSIAAGVDPFFHPVPGGQAALARHGVTRRAVLYAGAADPRKNLGALLAAFALLPAPLRATHQLALVGRMDPAERRQVGEMARRHGVPEAAIAFLGYVPDDDLRALYSACAAFVFPSLHEGFGLPALEAMACGAPTIGSSTTSIPEVIGRADALFDPTRPDQIAARLQAVLQDRDFAASLRASGLERATQFTWQASARRALAAFEALHAGRGEARRSAPGRRLTLAFIAPLPPERSGIASYSARLLPELACHYDITCIVDQRAIDAPWVTASLPVRDAAWFATHHRRFDRVLYQMGNSPFHQHMLPLLEACPGVVVLHDFHLGGLMARLARIGGDPDLLHRALYVSHGYQALIAVRTEGEAAALGYPANAAVLQRAMRVLVHSQHSIDLGRSWYGEAAAGMMRRIAFLPYPLSAPDREAARARLWLPPDAFLVCAFGALYPTKLNHRLAAAWRGSALVGDPDCRLAFVGEQQDDAYRRRLAPLLDTPAGGAPITVTGYVDDALYAAWLAAADVAVQLRTDSRGETSGAVFECLARGVPLVVNAHGAAAELPAAVAVSLPDDFSDAALARALETLRADPALRRSLAAQATEHLQAAHHPVLVADAYRREVEAAYAETGLAREQALLRGLGGISGLGIPAPSADDLAATAAAIVANRSAGFTRQILFDVTALSRTEFVSGIERAARAILMQLLHRPPAGWRVEPVRAEGATYVYARRYAAGLLDLGADAAWLADEPVEAAPGDLYLGLDWSADTVPRMAPWFRAQQRRGVRIVFKVYDMLPLLRPDFFPPAIGPMTQAWLDAVAEVADGVVCSSRAVIGELGTWLEAARPRRAAPLRLGWFHLGADLPATGSDGAPDPALADAMAARPSFLMVGTLEPRKGHAQALAAIERLWAEGIDANLVVIGRCGWMMQELADRLRHHAEAGRRLFWLDAAGDGVLRQAYAGATALLAASEGEGFGLPLTEAAQHGLPVIARDLPVFREVAAGSAVWFEGTDPASLAAVLQRWLAQGRTAARPVGWQSWRQSTDALLRVVLDGAWSTSWPASAAPEPAARALASPVAP